MLAGRVQSCLCRNDEDRRRRQSAGPRARKDRVKDRLTCAGKAAVTKFQRAQVRCQAEYDAIEVEVYEEQHPGRIKRRGLKVEATLCEDGATRDCVWIPKLAKGHHRIIAEQVTGTGVDETVDDGENIIRAGQIVDKYQALRDETLSSSKHAEAQRSVLESAEISEASLF